MKERREKLRREIDEDSERIRELERQNRRMQQGKPPTSEDPGEPQHLQLVVNLVVGAPEEGTKSRLKLEWREQRGTPPRHSGTAA